MELLIILDNKTIFNKEITINKRALILTGLGLVISLIILTGSKTLLISESPTGSQRGLVEKLYYELFEVDKPSEDWYKNYFPTDGYNIEILKLMGQGLKNDFNKAVEEFMSESPTVELGRTLKSECGKIENTGVNRYIETAIDSYKKLNNW